MYAPFAVPAVTVRVKPSPFISTSSCVPSSLLHVPVTVTSPPTLVADTESTVSLATSTMIVFCIVTVVGDVDVIFMVRVPGITGVMVSSTAFHSAMADRS